MNIPGMRWLVKGVVKQGTSLLCQIDAADLARVPPGGPLILYTNHTGSLEVPLLFAHLQPRPVTGFAKAETWNDPFMAWLFDLWGAIPIQRGEADMHALRAGLQALRQGYILGIAPEGTRNRDGHLRRARAGVVTLALHSRAPLLPVAHWGGEGFGRNLRRARRTEFHVRVGRPFRLRTDPGSLSRAVRQQIVDELMYQLAALLPETYRGEYRNLEAASQSYLEFIEPSTKAS
jgi:1-acyl-sn-glycerol-3-phosphate acyltransferase